MKTKHISTGTRQAYLDNQLSPAEQRQVEVHLADCPACVEKLQAQQKCAVETRGLLNAVAGSSRSMKLPQAQARYHAYSRIKEMENSQMNRSIFTRHRTAWMTAGLILLLSVALAFPQVRAIANSFLGLFRVQQITLVQVNDTLPEQLSQSTQMQLLFSEQMQFEQSAEMQVVQSADEASRLAGFNVRQPQDTAEPLEYQLTPAGTVRFTVDLDKLHAVFDELGRSDLRLPPAVDGAEVVAQIQAGVSLSMGPCVEMIGDPDNPESVYYLDCTNMLQIPSPTVEAPPGLDMRRIGEVYMQFLGMSAEDARAFSQDIDWENTLVVPIPSYTMKYQQVSVDGVVGTFLSPRSPQAGQGYLLFWVKDDIVYALNGEGTLADALNIVASLK